VKKVYWSYRIGEGQETDPFPPEYVNPPTKYRVGYDMKYDHAKCPAWKKWSDNCWMVDQPFDLGFKIKNNTIETNLSQASYEDYFHLGENWLSGSLPEIQMKYTMSLWTKDKDVWIEQIPHPLLSRFGLDLVPATFPISVWYRPLVVGVKVLDNDVFIPKGTPLYYFKLYSKRSDSDFKLEKKDPPKHLVKQLNQNNRFRAFTMFDAWDIIMKRVNNERKCPIKWN